MKPCSKCRAVKPFGEFHRSAKASDGRASWCKPCANTVTRAGRKRTYSAENKRKWAIKTRYGLTPAQVEAMREKQNGKCALCDKTPRKFHIDHCHRTGVIRGLLCHACNIRLGGWDDLAWKERALAYLDGGAA